MSTAASPTELADDNLDPPDARSTAAVLRRGAHVFGVSIRAHPRPFALSVLGSVVFTGMAVAGTYVLGEVTDRVIVPGLRDGVSGSTVAAGAAAIVGVALVRSAGVVLRRYFGIMTTRGMQRTWFQRITETYLRAPLSYISSQPTGRLIAHADADVERAITALMPLPLSLGVVVLIGLSMASLTLIDPLFMLVGLTLFPALALINHLYTRRVQGPASRTQSHLGAIASVAHESFEGALVVKTLGLESREVTRMRGVAEALRSARLGIGRLRATFEPALDALPNLGTVALLAVGAWRVSTGHVTTGQLVQAMALFGILTFPMRVLGFLLEEMPRAVVAVDRIERVLATPPRREPEPGVDVALPPGPLAVEVRGLRFGYGGAPTIAGLDLTLAPGEVVALVGATGAGKSTLCHLLAHLHLPQEGTIRLGGVDLAAADPASIRRSVALAFQEAFLFAATIRENLTLGEDVPDEDIAWALEQARADGFVGRLARGVDQEIGERGVSLSGGQRQRLALARALLRRPGLLMLDDATSAVDPVIEHEILDALREGLQATTLLVAHRVSTIALADRVLYMADGRIVASGTHEELLDGLGDYATLVRAYEDGRT